MSATQAAELELTVVLTDDAGKPVVEWVAQDSDFARVVGAVVLHTGRKVSAYSVEETPVEPGRAFVLKSLSGGTDSEGGLYCVQVTHGGRPLSCECRGFLRWGGECKHMAAVGALVRNGLV